MLFRCCFVVNLLVGCTKDGPMLFLFLQHSVFCGKMKRETVSLLSNACQTEALRFLVERVVGRTSAQTVKKGFVNESQIIPGSVRFKFLFDCFFFF